MGNPTYGQQQSHSSLSRMRPTCSPHLRFHTDSHRRLCISEHFTASIARAGPRLDTRIRNICRCSDRWDSRNKCKDNFVGHIRTFYQCRRRGSWFHSNSLRLCDMLHRWNMMKERINRLNANIALQIVQKQSVLLRSFSSTGRFLNV